MKRRIAVLLLFFTVLSGFAQELNKFDAAGKRHGKWKGTYDNTRVRYEGSFEPGVEPGVFKFYEDNAKSTLTATRDFTAGNGVSYTVIFDANGKKLSEGKEVNRLRKGEWKFYFPGKDKLMSVEQYKDGKLTGTRKVFFESGSVAEEAGYKDGLRNGKYKKYTEKGILLEDSTYKNGQLNGPASFYNGSGELDSQGQYANNVRTGVWKFYVNGKLTKQEDLTNKKIELERQRD